MSPQNRKPAPQGSSLAHHLACLACATLFLTPFPSSTGHTEDSSSARPSSIPSTTDLCGTPLSLEELRAMLIRSSPAVAKIDATTAQEMARARATELVANPELQLEQTFTRMNIGGANDPQTSASLGQPLRLSDFGTRARVASLIKKSASSERKRELLSLSQRAVRYAAAIDTLTTTIDRISRAERQALAYRTILDQGVASGLVTTGDRALIVAEYHRLRAERVGAEAQRITAQSTLSQIVGASCLVQLASAPPPPSLPPLGDILTRAATSGITEYDRAELLLELADEESRRADEDALPPITPRLVYQHTNDGGDFLGVGFSFALPVWHRNDPERSSRAIEKISAARHKTFLKEGGFTSHITGLYRALEAIEEQIRVLERDVMPTFQEALAAQENLFRSGKGNVLQLWQSVRASHEASRDSLTLRQRAIGMRSRLSLLIGDEL